MFVAIGHDPATGAFAGAVELDDEGYILADAGGTEHRLMVFLLPVIVSIKSVASSCRGGYGLYGGS